MRRRLCVAGVLATLATLAAAPADAAVTVRALDTSRLPIVRVTVLLGDQAPGAQPAFTVAENGQPVQGIEVSKPDGRTAFAIAVDTSGSMRGAPLAAAIAAATSFIGQMKAGDEVTIIGFGHNAYVGQSLTTDPTQIRAGIESLAADHVPGTTINDAALLALKELATSTDASRRIVLMLSDGRDSNSTATAADVTATAAKDDVAIHTIALKSSSYFPDALQQLAADTGGSFHDASSDSLKAVYAQIADELSRTYVLSYRSSQSQKVDLTIAADGNTVTTGYVGGTTPAILRGGLVPASAVLPAWSAYALAAAAFLLLLLGGVLVFRPRPQRSLRSHLDAYSEFAKRNKVEDEFSEAAPTLIVRLARSTERILGELQFWKKAAAMIERADLPLRTGELFYLMLGSAMVFGLPAGFLGTPALLTLILLAIGFLLPIVVVRFKAKKRQKAFDNQLPDTLVAMAASLKVGHSWNQAMDTVVKEGVDPMKAEFTRVASEVRLGRASDEALEGMARRIGSTDFEFVMLSVNIQRQIGGSLAELLDQVAETVRLRQQFRRKVKALTSMGRMSAYTLVALPFMMGAGIMAMNASYMDPLFYTGTGHMLIVVAFVMMGFGALLLKKIVSFKA